MIKTEELSKQRQKLYSNTNELFSKVDTLANESIRVADVAHNAEEIIQNIDDRFEEQTKLHGKDIFFLFFATALQCVRQYLITDFNERLPDQEAAKKTKGHGEEHSNRKHQLYNPTLDEILTNPVPFDTTFGAPSMGSDIAQHGGHRYTTLGHDPILGWIFGTANIATSTLTDYKFMSYHILTGKIKNGQLRDKITKHADTEKVFSYTFDKLLNQGKEGKIIIASAILKEANHLKSDVKTVNSLPFPIISTLSPDLASHLADYGIDMENICTVGEQVSYAIAINEIIAMIHRLTFNEKTDGTPELYEVRTHRIITYSNVIASSSNILAVAIGAAIGAVKKDTKKIEKSVSKIDIGGFLVTLNRLLSDRKFTSQIKTEFVLNNFDKLIQGDYK